MNFGEAIKSVFNKYATFSGRARRSEYWFFYLFNVLVRMGLGFVSMIFVFCYTLFEMAAKSDFAFPNYYWFFYGIIYGVVGLWALAVFLPFMAVTVRRFHDIGKSGWWLLVMMLPGFVYLCYLACVIYNAAVHDCEPDMKLFLIVTGLGILIGIGFFVWQIVWLVRDSEPGDNKYGPNPKGISSNMSENASNIESNV